MGQEPRDEAYLVPSCTRAMMGPGMPSTTTPGTPRPPVTPGYTQSSGSRLGKCAMGSKEGVRNSLKDLEVILRPTIWPLAAILAPCCKNRLSLKAPGYLHLSNPLEILSRTKTLP